MSLTSPHSIGILLAILLLGASTARAQEVQSPQFVQMVQQGCERGVPAEIREQLSSAKITNYCGCYAQTITRTMSGEEMQEAISGGTQGLTQHPKVQEAAQDCALKAFR